MLNTEVILKGIVEEIIDEMGKGTVKGIAKGICGINWNSEVIPKRTFQRN